MGRDSVTSSPSLHPWETNRPVLQSFMRSISLTAPAYMSESAAEKKAEEDRMIAEEQYAAARAEARQRTREAEMERVAASLKEVRRASSGAESPPTTPTTDPWSPLGPLRDQAEEAVRLKLEAAAVAELQAMKRELLAAYSPSLSLHRLNANGDCDKFECSCPTNCTTALGCN